VTRACFHHFHVLERGPRKCWRATRAIRAVMKGHDGRVATPDSHRDESFDFALITIGITFFSQGEAAQNHRRHGNNRARQQRHMKGRPWQKSITVFTVPAFGNYPGSDHEFG
jgi:hypothetical protein